MLTIYPFFATLEVLDSDLFTEALNRYKGRHIRGQLVLPKNLYLTLFELKIMNTVGNNPDLLEIQGISLEQPLEEMFTLGETYNLVFNDASNILGLIKFDHFFESEERK